MSYIVQRNSRFYVVAYNGHDPITGRERRRWHPAGTDRTDAITVQRRIDRQRPDTPCAMHMGGFMATTWMASKCDLTHHTANRYRWMFNHNIAPRIDAIRLDALGPADLDACYANLITNGARRRQGLSPKAVLEMHRVIPNALDLAVDRQLIDTNPARRARPPRRRLGQRSPQSGTLSNSAISSRLRSVCGSTRPCISWPTPGCAAVKWPDSTGAT